MRRSQAPSYFNKTAPPRSTNKLILKKASDFGKPDRPNCSLENPRISSAGDSLPGEKTTSTCQSVPDSNNLRYFSVVYGKRSTKKHKTWEGDGVLEVGIKSVTLKDEDGKTLGEVANIKTADLAEGSRLFIGSKEVEIIDLKAPEPSVQKRPLEPLEENVLLPRPSKKKKTSLMNLNGLSYQPMTLNSKAKTALHSEYEELVLPRPTDEHQWTYNPDCLPVSEVRVPAHLCRVLRPHQREGVTFLYRCLTGIRSLHHLGAILADEMGLGKTLQCITLIWTLLNSGPYGGRPFIRKVLIVVPSSLTQNWNNEFIRWIGSHRVKAFVVDKNNRPEDYKRMTPNPPILIISYEMFMRGFDDIKDIDFDLIICDEGHRLKNCSIKTTSSLNLMNCKRRILLTGTPIQNDLQEFYALIHLVNPGILGNQSEFKRKYVDSILASREPNASEETLQLGVQRSEELNRLTSTFILRRTQNVIDKFLPCKSEFVVFCELTNIQKHLYSTTTNYWLEQLDEKIRNHEPSEHLSVIHALKKICNHPILIRKESLEKDFSDENLSSRLNKILSENNISRDLACDSGKLAILDCLLKRIRNTKERIVLVSNFTQTLDLFEDVCKRSEYKYLRLDGSTPSSARLNIVNRFNAPISDIYILLLSSKAGGVGLNLIGGSRLVLYDSDWNPATDLQAMARVWREGQRKPVYIYRFLSSGTIEEKIFQRQLSKAGLSESIVDPAATSNVKLSLEELKDLFTYTGCEKCITHSSLKCGCEGDGKIPTEFAPATTGSYSVQGTADDGSTREAELLPQNNTMSAPSLRMNQLFQWEHHVGPVDLHVLQDMGLSDAVERINYVFKNKTQ